MTISKSIVLKTNNRNHISIVLLIIMTQISVLNCVGSTNRLISALALPKWIPPKLTKSSGASSKLLLQYRPVRSIFYRSSKVQMMMSIVDDVTAEMKVAMKAKDSVTLGTIRLIRSAFANAAIELRTEHLTDEQVRYVGF